MLGVQNAQETEEEGYYPSGAGEGVNYQYGETETEQTNPNYQYKDYSSMNDMESDGIRKRVLGGFYGGTINGFNGILRPEIRHGGRESQRPGISVGVGGGGKPNYIYGYGYEYETYGGQDF